MNPLLDQLGEQQTARFFLVLARVGPLFLLAPLFSARQVPGRVRGIIAVALALGLTPVVADGQRIELGAFPLAELIAKEILVGLAFAFAVGSVITAVSIAGSLLDLLGGFSLGGTLDPVTGNQSALLAQMYTLIGTLVFVAIGGDALVLLGFARTYDFVPLLEYPALDTLTAGAQAAFVSLFVGALELAAPVILALIVTDAAFGLMTRVVPQLQVFTVGAPAKIGVCLFFAATSLTFAAGWMSDELERSVSNALRSLKD